MNQPISPSVCHYSMDWEQKYWGRVQHIFVNPYSSVSYLETQPKTRCSWHYHEERINLFKLVSGLIVIEHKSIREQVYEGTVRHVMRPGDLYEVNCKVIHRFRSVEASTIVEVYWPDPEYKHTRVRIDDIKRLDEGSSTDDQSDLKELLANG